MILRTKKKIEETANEIKDKLQNIKMLTFKGLDKYIIPDLSNIVCEYMDDIVSLIEQQT